MLDPKTARLSRPFSETVRERAERDPGFREALKEEGVEVPQATADEIEALARRLCLEDLTRIGEEEFRSGRFRPDQVAEAMAATLRTRDRVWRDWIPDAMVKLGSGKA